ncbi:MAG: hypothetical protein LCH69_19235 [Proteobacteria bacterium]|nr:hypothetical protein [Pseudomonadota bacterium]
MKMISGTAIAAAMLLGQIAPAMATTVTFDNLTDYLVDQPYFENGVRVDATNPGEALASEFTPGALHLDDAGTGLAAGARFTTGSIFDVLGFSFISLGFTFFDEAPEVIGNILIRGFLNGVEVVRDRVSMSPVLGTVQNINLDSAFSGLDAFTIEVLYPNTEAWCDAPCGHLDLDSVSFNGVGPVPVPLPASGLLLGLAAGGMWLMGRRRRA